MIQLKDISVSFGGRVLFENVNWHLGFEDRIGLVGANGSGKSTLLKIIAGVNQPDSGSVIFPKSTSFGYLPQENIFHKGKTVFDEAASAYRDVVRLQEEMAVLEENLQTLDSSSPEMKETMIRYSEISEHLRVRDGYQMEANVEKVLRGLGFGREDLTRDCGEFSGGWQMRIALSKILLSEPTVLLLDEPTNYLDLEAREFLEDWLKGYKCPLMLVSHDRYFMDRVINRVTEAFNGGLDDYHCDYTRFLVERETRVELLRKKAQEINDERERIQAFINKFRYKADKAALVQSRIKQLEKLEDVKIPPERKKIHFRFPAPPRSGGMVLEFKSVSAGYEAGADVFSGASFELFRGDKVPLVGINGAGKTTMMKLVAGLMKPREGLLKTGHNVTMDYFAQDSASELDPDLTVYETLERTCPFDFVPRLRGLLGAFLFSGDDVEKKTRVLSGGEKNRLVLARMLLAPSNFLILDEPTNHLDLESKEILLDALKRFEGTVFYVSHDRYFLDHLSNKVVAIDSGRVSVYPGSYSDFLWKLGRIQAEAAAATERAAADADSVTSGRPDNGESSKEARVRQRDEEKRKKRDRERLEKIVANLEQEIGLAEKELKSLEIRMSEPGVASDFAELSKMLKRREDIIESLKALNEKWETEAEKLSL